MNKTSTKRALMEQHVRALPSLSQEAMAEIVEGMYAKQPLFGEQGLLMRLIKDLAQVALQGEMDAHLAEGGLEEGGNRRNGITRKTMKTAGGMFEMEQPRDRRVFNELCHGRFSFP